MKRLIIISTITLVVIIGGIVLVNYLNQRTISVTLPGSGYSVDILNSDKKVTSLASSGDVRLADGEYVYKVVGDGYASDPVAFTVTREAEPVTVEARYSSEKLDALLESERGSITNALVARYPDIFSNFSFYQLKLYDQGEWAAGILNQIVDRRDSPDYYRFVAHKVSGVWVIAVPPQIAIERSAYPEVPADIVYSLYTDSTPYAN